MLSALDDLDLSDNDLSGTIPKELGELSRLERLNLRPKPPKRRYPLGVG